MTGGTKDFIMNLSKLFDLLTKIMKDAELWAAIMKLVDFFNSLSPTEQTTYLSKFNEENGGFGCPCDPDCPDCPDDCLDAEAAILAALQ